MSWRDHLGIFVLTKEEQRTVAFIVLVFALGLVTKHYRATHAEKASPNEFHASATPTATPR